MYKKTNECKFNRGPKASEPNWELLGALDCSLFEEENEKRKVSLNSQSNAEQKKMGK